MIEIIVLILLTRRIGQIAEQKGLEPRRWKMNTVFLWLASELLGGYISKSFGQTNIFILILTGFGFAIASFFTMQDYLLKMDDKKQKRIDINKHVED